MFYHDNFLLLTRSFNFKKLFLIEGILTVVVSIISYFFLSNYPEKSMWLSEEERKYAVERLKNDAGKAHVTHYDKKLIYAALTDWVRKLYINSNI